MNSGIDAVEVTLYQKRPPQNSIVDDLLAFLTGGAYTSGSAKLKTPSYKLTDFRVELGDYSSFSANFPYPDPNNGEERFGYMRIGKTPTSSGDNVLFYYIDSIDRVSNGVARINATLDVLNTYFARYYDDTPAVWTAISPKSRITRRLVDRFVNDTSRDSSLKSIIDPQPEGLSPKLYCSPIRGELDAGESAPYAGNTVGTAPDAWVAVLARLHPEDYIPTLLVMPRWESLTISEAGAQSSYLRANVQTDLGVTQTGAVLMSYNMLNPTSEQIIAIFSWPTLPDTWANILKGVTTYSQSNKWKCVQITNADSHLLLPAGDNFSGTAFAIAYNGNAVNKSTESVLRIRNQGLKGSKVELKDTNAYANSAVFDAFFNTLTGVSHRKPNSPRLHFDPKECSSEFFQLTLIYDTTSLPLRFEEWSMGSTWLPDCTVSINYSLDMSGQFFFSVDIEGATRLFRDNAFDTLLQVDRGNKESFFTSDYLYYMRNGYNYDVKAQNLATWSRWTSFALNTASAVGTTAVGAVTGNFVTAAQGVGQASNIAGNLANTIIGQISAQNEFDRKINSVASQAMQISDVSANDLFRMYQGSEFPFFVQYRPRQTIIDLVDDLFFYYGYTRSETLGRLAEDFELFRENALNSRYWFDFVEMTIEWLPSACYLDSEILDAIRARFAEGVTIFHHNSNGTSATWDFAQQYENWEVWVL